MSENIEINEENYTLNESDMDMISAAFSAHVVLYNKDNIGSQIIKYAQICAKINKLNDMAKKNLIKLNKG